MQTSFLLKLAASIISGAIVALVAMLASLVIQTGFYYLGFLRTFIALTIVVIFIYELTH